MDYELDNMTPQQKQRFDNLMNQSKAIPAGGVFVSPTSFERSELPDVLTVTENGQENIYFFYLTTNNEIKEGVCKCL